MPTQLQFRRGTTAQNGSFTGAVGELSIDTDTKNIRIHDGSNAGGAEMFPAGLIIAAGTTTLPPNGGWKPATEVILAEVILQDYLLL